MAPLFRLAAAMVLLSAALISSALIIEPASSSNPAVNKRGTSSLIKRCTVSGTMAVTFDDGPWKYTNELLDILKEKKVKATFFVNGANYDSIFKYKNVVRRAKDEGHQIGSHTWDHADLTKRSKKEILTEMKKREFLVMKALNSVHQKPQLRTDKPLVNSGRRAEVDHWGTSVEATLISEGYKIVIWDVDSGDSQGKTPDQSFQDYEQEVTQPGHIILNHDVYYGTVREFIADAIDLALSKGYKLIPVGACLGEPESSWYR
ncbi:hypothetical protein BGX28_000233 [Mortierella sp. GBA30]|nr:hypothetical protein BGX28_000233 [Mortierella sp. GBA30]